MPEPGSRPKDGVRDLERRPCRREPAFPFRNGSHCKIDGFRYVVFDRTPTPTARHIHYETPDRLLRRHLEHP